ncbi:uncharacterized protein, partial [Temnothorax longispinosus]|uniref:uncharacterized protein n=1 Tax=Temnothorax longispinosus TaxID=300112 RepID=UPI003A998036
RDLKDAVVLRCNFHKGTAFLRRRFRQLYGSRDKFAPRFVTVVRFLYLRQKCCGSRRLAGGASKSEVAPADKSPSPESLKREAGGGCPPPNCSRPSTRYNSPMNADCASTASSCCPSQCRYPQASPHRASDCLQPCARKSILKKRSCCQCNNASRCCLCQPMPRGCNCPPPIQVDARAAHECSCDCPSSPECACPPSERRFPKTTAKCPNARLCCPSPRLPPTPKCYCPRCQPCPPPPCGPCTSAKCRRPLPLKDLCSPCPSCPPCRPVSTASPCRVTPTPCRNLTFCNERGGRPSSPCTGQSWRGITGDRSSESSIGSKQNGNEIRELHNRKDRDCCYADCIGSEIESKYTDKNRNLTLNEGYTHQNLESKTFINLSETTNPSKSVDPDSYVSEERDETAFENAAEALEECTIEKSSKDSWYTSPTPASSNSGTEPDYYAFQEEYPPTGRNVSGNLVLRVILREAPQARVEPLAGVSISILATTPTRGIDRQRRNGGALREDTTDARSLPWENRVIRLNAFQNYRLLRFATVQSSSPTSSSEELTRFTP